MKTSKGPAQQPRQTQSIEIVTLVLIVLLQARRVRLLSGGPAHLPESNTSRYRR